MSGHVGDLSPLQEEALSKLKATVADITNKPDEDDYFYLRWLRARKFKVSKAEEMIRNHMVFRSEMDVDNILETWTPPEVLQKCFPGGFFGEDREGHPIWYDNYGNLDFRGIHRACKKEDVLKLKVYHLEMTGKVCKDFTKKKGRDIETVTSIIDLENLSYQRHYYWPGITLFRETVAMFEANYPERSKKIIVVRAPKAFPFAFSLIKPFLHPVTRDKIALLGSNWKEEIREYISPDQLPQAYGGTRCEPDPWCTDHINPGCDIPPEYYLTNLTETDKQEMDRVVVERRGSCELEYEVDMEGSVLRWEFITTSHDVGYSVLYKSESTDSLKKGSKVQMNVEEVVPLQRTDSHLVPEVGKHECGTTGTYVLKFDNSHSWTRSKEVYYSVNVLPPNTELNPLLMPSTHTDQQSSSDDDFFDCDDEEGLQMRTPAVSVTAKTESPESSTLDTSASPTI